MRKTLYLFDEQDVYEKIVTQFEKETLYMRRERSAGG